MTGEAGQDKFTHAITFWDQRTLLNINIQKYIKEIVQVEELTASEFLRSVSISESASIHGESFPTIRVFQSRESTMDS